MESDIIMEQTEPSFKTPADAIPVTPGEYAAYEDALEHSQTHRGSGDDPRVVDLHAKIAHRFTEQKEVSAFIHRLETLRILQRIETGIYGEHVTHVLDQKLYLDSLERLLLVNAREGPSRHDALRRKVEKRISMLEQEEQEAETHLSAVRKVLGEERERHRKHLKAIHKHEEALEEIRVLSPD